MKIKIHKFRFSDGSVVSYSPTEYRIITIIANVMGWEEIDPKYNLRNFGYGESMIRDIFREILTDTLNQDKDPNRIRKEVSDAVAATLVASDLIYNGIGYNSLEYMYPLSLNDMVEIVEDPDLVKAIRELATDPTQKNVIHVYDVLDKVMHSPKYENNKVAQVYTDKLANTMQMKQCYGSRGFVLNLDGVINKIPVTSNYLLGLYDNYEYVLDSKSAAMALYYSGTAIQHSEVFSNSLQTACSLIENVVYTDCGTKAGMKYTVQGPGLNEHGEPYKGDLPIIAGLMYKLHEDDEWVTIKGDETFLYGKDIILRMPYNCMLKNRHSICIKCLGKLGYHADPDFNIGMYLVSRLSDLLNQIILSAKHLISNAVADVVSLNENTAKYLYIKDNYIYVDPKWIGKNWTLSVSLKEFYGYKDLEGKTISQLNHYKLSSVFNIVIRYGKTVEELHVGFGDRRSIFTKDFIAYVMKEKKVSIDDRLVLHVNMLNWRKTFKLLEVPETNFDVRAYNASIRNFITGGKSPDGVPISKMTRDEYVLNLHRLISRKFTVSFTTLGLIARVVGVRDPKNSDYRIAIEGEPYTLTSINKILTQPFVTGIYSTGKIKMLNSVDTYTPERHMDHLLDVYLAPQECVELEREGYYKRE